MTTLFALDPGKTSGWCVLSVSGGKAEVVEAGQGDGIEPVLHLRKLLYEEVPFDYVIYEEFLANPETLGVLRNRESLIPLEVIGVLKYIMRSSPDVPLIGYPAAQRKFFTDARLRRLGCYVKGGHARDAVRHALAFAAFQLKELNLSPLVPE